MAKRIVLFDGTNFDNFKSVDGSPVTWDNDGECMTVKSKNIVSTVEFSDAHIHVEFRTPDMPEAVGQAKGNSGVYVHGCYEIQVLDSYGKEKIKSNDCGSIYRMYTPVVNACLPPMQWQTYDIYITAPVIDENGKKLKPAVITVIHNGKTIHNKVVLNRATPGGITDMPVTKGPLMLQDHGNLVSFRNIWIEPLSDNLPEKRIEKKGFWAKLFRK